MDAPDLSHAMWRKEQPQQRHRVEVAVAPEAVAVRDSKKPGGPVLAFPAVRWTAFLSARRPSP